MFMKQVKKLIGLLNISLLVGAMLLGGCSSKEKADGSKSGVAQPTQSTQQAVQMHIFFYHETLVQGFESLAKAFNEENPHVTITTEMIGPEFNTVLKTKEAVGKLPEIFAASSPGEPALKPYIQAGKIADVSSLKVINQLSEDYRKSITFTDGKIYTVPFTITSRGLIYNEEIFNTYGISPPTTLDELARVCKTLKANNIIPFGISGKAAWSVGSCIFQPGQELFSSPEWAADMDAGKASFVDNALPVFDLIDLAKENCQPNMMSTDYMDIMAMYGEGQVAMLMLPSDVLNVLEGISPEAAEVSRIIGIPYTNDPEKNKLYIDYSASFAISSAADLEVVDRFFDFVINGKGKEIFITQMKSLNPYGIDFETFQGNKDVLSHIEQGNIINDTQYLLMPDGFWQSNGMAMQTYLGGGVDQEGMLRLLDKDWQTIINKQ